MRAILPLLAGLAVYSAAAGQARPDTFQVYFALNSDHLADGAAAHLDSLLYQGRLQPGKPVQIIGYGDYIGSEGANRQLSARRAAHVQQYLLASGFRKDSIILCIGKGAIARPGQADPGGYAQDRRVDIIVNPLPQPPKPAVVVRPVPKVPALPPPAFDERGIPYASSVRMINMKVGETFILDSIYFDAGRHFMRHGTATRGLHRLLELMQEYPTVKVQIEGHVCCVMPGLETDDAEDFDTGEPFLSVNRAKYVYEYLVKEGIDSARLSYKGFGRKFPVRQEEHTQEDMAVNRRVEIRIMAK